MRDAAAQAAAELSDSNGCCKPLRAENRVHTVNIQNTVEASDETGATATTAIPSTMSDPQDTAISGETWDEEDSDTPSDSDSPISPITPHTRRSSSTMFFRPTCEGQAMSSSWQQSSLVVSYSFCS